VGARELSTEEDIGVGGGARGPVVRFEARVARSNLVGIREVGEGCASHLAQLVGCAGERRLSWRTSGVREPLVIHAWRVATGPYVISRRDRKHLTIGATAALNHVSYHLILCFLDERRLLGKVSGARKTLAMTE
jgi:hypothetical protein